MLGRYLSLRIPKNENHEKMKKSINSFVNGLSGNTDLMKERLKAINSKFSVINLSNLTEAEKGVNTIHLFRSIDDYATQAVFYNVQSVENIIEVESDFTLANKYLSHDYIDLESYIEDEFNDQQLDEFFIECDKKYLLWLINIYHSVECHLNSRIVYVSVENNSGRSFDLNRMKWDNDVISNVDSNDRYYNSTSKFNTSEALSRILVDYDY
jgi:predicted component of type VI protein secretion system